MKQLQNDFTTREQSKRLLELGLPADSANMHYQEECVRIEYGKEEFEYFLHYGKPDTNKYSTDIPSWSVGRLMEIFEICTGLVWQNEIIDGYSKVDMLLEDFEDREQKYTFNFSKLED